MKKDTFNPDLFASWKWEGSIVILFGNWIVNFFTILSFFPLIDSLLIPKKLTKNKLWIRELFVLLVALLPTFALFFFDPKSAKQFWIALFCLLNVSSAILRDLIVAPQKYYDDHEGEYILVRSGLRWLLIAPIQAYSIIICFAIMLLFYGNQFNPIISDPLTALYQSALTFTTLGYGDITPICWKGKFLVVFELMFLFLFICIKLPIAASVLRVKKEQKSSEKNY